MLELCLLQIHAWIRRLRVVWIFLRWRNWISVSVNGQLFVNYDKAQDFNWTFQIESTVFILSIGPDSDRLTEVHGLVSKIEADIL